MIRDVPRVESKHVQPDIKPDVNRGRSCGFSCLAAVSFSQLRDAIDHEDPRYHSAPDYLLTSA